MVPIRRGGGPEYDGSLGNTELAIAHGCSLGTGVACAGTGAAGASATGGMTHVALSVSPSATRRVGGSGSSARTLGTTEVISASVQSGATTLLGSSAVRNASASS